MSNKVIKKLSIGKCNATLWQGEYQGKPTYSVSFQKSYKAKDEWKNTNFFTLPDLRDLYILIGHIVNKQVKEKQQSNKQTQQPAQNNDVPFEIDSEIDEQIEGAF